MKNSRIPFKKTTIPTRKFFYLQRALRNRNKTVPKFSKEAARRIKCCRSLGFYYSDLCVLIKILGLNEGHYA